MGFRGDVRDQGGIEFAKQFRINIPPPPPAQAWPDERSSAPILLRFHSGGLPPSRSSETARSPARFPVLGGQDYTILYYTILYYSILFYTINYTILYFTILHYTTLYYTILYTIL